MAKATTVSGIGPTTPLRLAADAVVSVRLADVRRYERRIKGRLRPDDVHDMRVATRRLRAALKLVGVSKHVDREVKRFQDALGAVRDIHVQLDWMEGAAKDAERKTRQAIEAIENEYSSRLLVNTRTLHRELPRWQTQTVPLIRAAMTQVKDERPLGGNHFRGIIRKRLRQVRDRMQTFADAQDAGSAHQLRIQAKKLRYLAELLEPVWPDKIAVVLASLKPLQEIFGNLHDADVRVMEFSRIAGSHPDEEQGALDLLVKANKEREKVAAEAAALVLHWQSERVAPGLRQLFARQAVTS